MADEISPEEQQPFIDVSTSHSVSQNRGSKKINVISSFLGKLNSVFTTVKSDHQKELMGRARNLNKESVEIAAKLEKIKSELCSKADPHFVAFVATVIDPTIKRMLQISESTALGALQEQAKSVDRFVEWVKNAKSWVEFYSEVDNKDKITEAVLQHIFMEVFKLIDRDIQFMMDYQKVVVSHLMIDDQHKRDLERTMSHLIFPHLEALEKLKREPKKLDIEKTGEWKTLMDETRSHHVNAAIHQIDQLLEKVSYFQPGTEDII